MSNNPVKRPSSRRLTSLRRWAARYPILLYRIGLGGWIGGRVMLLTTTGRRTGHPSITPLWYVRQGEEIYTLARHGPKTQWVQNLRHNPRVTLQLGKERWQAQARVVEDPRELAQAVKLYLAKYGVMARILFRRPLIAVAFHLLNPSPEGSR